MAPPLTKEQDELTDKLNAAAKESGGEVRYDYSGRCMFGQNCVGIDGDEVAVLMAIGKHGLPRPKVDSSGSHEIIAYWPDFKTDAAGEHLI